MIIPMTFFQTRGFNLTHTNTNRRLQKIEEFMYIAKITDPVVIKITESKED